MFLNLLALFDVNLILFKCVPELVKIDVKLDCSIIYQFVWLHHKIDQTECLKSFDNFSENRCSEECEFPVVISDFLALLIFVLDILVVIVE